MPHSHHQSHHPAHSVEPFQMAVAPSTRLGVSADPPALLNTKQPISSPNLVQASALYELVLSGTHLDKGAAFGDNRDKSSTVFTKPVLGNIFVSIRRAISPQAIIPELIFPVDSYNGDGTAAAFNLPANVLAYTELAGYVVFWALGNPVGVQPTKGFNSLSNLELLTLRAFDLDSSMFNIFPVQGGSAAQIGIYNLPSRVATGTLTLTPKNLAVAQYPGAPTGIIRTSIITVSGFTQRTDVNEQLITGSGLFHFASPQVGWEGLYSLSLTLSAPAVWNPPKDTESPPDPDDPDTQPTLQYPAQTSADVLVPGPGMVACVPALGDLQGTVNPSVTGAIAFTVQFKDGPTKTSQASKWDQSLPYTHLDTSIPSWVIGLTRTKNTDSFDWNSVNDGGMFIDGKQYMFYKSINDDPSPDDDTSASPDDDTDDDDPEDDYEVQIMEISGYSTLVNGSPVAVRVFVKSQPKLGWRCARMDVNSLTYSQLDSQPRRWIVDSTSGPFPAREEEIFGIYQLVHNPQYKEDVVMVGGLPKRDPDTGLVVRNRTTEDDDANHKALAYPAIIETSRNEIMLGIDKIVLVPTAYSRNVDPYYCKVGGDGVPVTTLTNLTAPPQSLMSGMGGFTDGIKPDLTKITAYMTAYINYQPPSAAVTALATPTAPGTAEAEVIGCTCMASAELKRASNTAKWMLLVASEPAVTSRPCQLFYSFYAGPANATPDVIKASPWKPLMSNTLAAHVGNGVGQVEIVQTSETAVTLFQRSRTDLLQVYECIVDYDNQQLTLADPNTVASNGVKYLSDEAIMDSIVGKYKSRFGLVMELGVQINAIIDTFFCVLYQAPDDGVSMPGFHIFTIPYTYTSSVIHLYYAAKASAAGNQVIDEKSGKCVGIYGSIRGRSIQPTDTSAPAPPLLRAITGVLGSEVDLIVKNVTYGGTDPVYLEFKAVKPASSSGPFTLSAREWSTVTKNGWQYVGTIQTADANVQLKLANGFTCTLSVAWAPTGSDVGTATSIDTSTIKADDVWIINVMPYSVDDITSGYGNQSNATIVTNSSSCTLPGYSQSFRLKYFAPPPNSADGVKGRLDVEGATVIGGSGDPVIANGQYTLKADDTIEVKTGNGSVTFTLVGAAHDGDQWELAINSGVFSQTVSGTINKGQWGYPVFAGSYDGRDSIRGQAACLKSVLQNSDPPATSFDISMDNGKAKTEITADLKPLVSPANSDGVYDLLGWQPIDLPQATTLMFGFENLSGMPSVNDNWNWQVSPSMPTLELFGQRPTVVAQKDGASAWIFVPTKSAGGRILQLNIPLQIVDGQEAVPLRSSLLSLRTTLDLKAVSTATGAALVFKGLHTEQPTWSASVKAELKAARDELNVRQYGLFKSLGADYRAAHSGNFYTVALDDTGADVSSVAQYSDPDLDIITEPTLPDDLVKQLPPVDWTYKVTDPNPPEHKPAVWLSIFPQYRFHIGTVASIALAKTVFSLTSTQVGTLLAPGFTSASAGRPIGMKDSDQTFFVNVRMPAADTVAYSAYRAAATAAMSDATATQFLGPLNDKGKRTLNPFDDDGFAYNYTYTPDTSDYSVIAKSMLQLMMLRSMWASTPSWPASLDTNEGRVCDDYWKFRIGGPVADRFMNEMSLNITYTNERNKQLAAQHDKYFADVKYLATFNTAWGSPAICTASVVMDTLLLPSFGQLDPTTRGKITGYMSQQVAGGGLHLLRQVSSYLAYWAIMSSATSVSTNVVTDIPMKITDPADKPTGEDWALRLAKFSGPLMNMGMLGAGLVQALFKYDAGQLHSVMEKFTDVSSRAYNRMDGAPADRAVIWERPASRPILANEDIAVQPAGVNVVQESIAENVTYDLSTAMRTEISGYRSSLRKAGIGGQVMQSIVTFALVSAQIAKIKSDLADIDTARGVFSVVVDGAIIVGALTQFGVTTAQLVQKFRLLRKIESGTLSTAMDAQDIYRSIQTLEKVGSALGGALNVAFGVQILMSGSDELKEDGKHLDGQLDVSSGVFMLVGGLLEMGALGLSGSGALYASGIGSILAGIGMEIGIIKVWIGGRKSIDGFGEGLIELIPFGHLSGGTSEAEQWQNYIVRVKQLALETGVSVKVTKSPDDNDDGAEDKSKLLISAPYSLADLNPK